MLTLQLVQVLLLLSNSFELHIVGGQDKLDENHEEEDPAKKVKCCVFLLDVASGQIGLHVDGELFLHVVVVSVPKNDLILLHKQLSKLKGVI